MNPNCDQVAERVALGEELGDLAEHAASCARCRRVVALPVDLASRKRDADPGMGFAARMTAGAQHRLVVRRQRRIAVGTAISVAAAAAIAVVVMRPTDEPSFASVFSVPAPQHQAVQPQPPHHKKDPWKSRDVDDDVKSLVQLANIERSSHLSANWGRIEKPLKPYRAVIKGTQP
jgi:hypothetical protein